MDRSQFERATNHAKLKIKRANRHLDEASGAFAAYLKTDFCRVVEESNSGPQEFFAVADPLPSQVALSIGDAFHNLSASLDYVMTGMMRAKTGSAKRVGFPTDETRKALRKSFMAPKPGKTAPPNRRIIEAFPWFVRLLLGQIKPYNGGPFRLWEIRKADNIDKHNFIVPTVTISRLENVFLYDPKLDNQSHISAAIVGPGGKVGLEEYGYGGMEIRNKGQATASITFPDGAEIFAGEPVLPTLAQCSQLCREAIDIIEEAFNRSNKT